MAKRATAKPEGKAPALPNSADVEVSPPGVPPAIDTPSSGSSEPLVDEVAPAEVSGVSPPQVSSSPEQVNQPNTNGLIDLPAEETPQADSNQPTDSAPPDDPATAGEGKAAEPNPAIELAKRHKVAAGKPREGLPRYITPPPFDVFAKKKAK